MATVGLVIVGCKRGMKIVEALKKVCNMLVLEGGVHHILGRG